MPSAGLKQSSHVPDEKDRDREDDADANQEKYPWMYHSQEEVRVGLAANEEAPSRIAIKDLVRCLCEEVNHSDTMEEGMKRKKAESALYTVLDDGDQRTLR